MEQLTFFSKSIHYALITLLGLFTVLLAGWQVMVLRGKAMKNPDGSTDDWHEQKIIYGMAFADLFVIVPACLAGIVLVFINLAWGCYLLSLVGFWFVWVNVVTTVTSLRFEKPKITANWFIIFPTGAIVGLAYLAWMIVHFDTIFSR
ncbi:hypothetical protein ACFL6N_05255 [Thermodesulfobacteriota bacterium]